MRKLIFALQAVASYLILQPKAAPPSLDPQLFATAIHDVMENTVKREEMQTYLDSLIYEERIPQEDQLETMAESMGKKFEIRERLIRRLQQAVIDVYEKNATGPPPVECCLIKEQFEFNQRYNLSINSAKVCFIMRVLSSRGSYRMPAESTFKEACLKNLEELPILRWQYFVSERGVATIFPAFKLRSCRGRDSRTSSWYIQANVPNPKEVVIVIDKSGSMDAFHGSITLMDLAVEAAKSVVLTLNPRDKFAVVAFSSSAEAIRADKADQTCFTYEMAKATPQNREVVNAFLDNVEAQGGTFYGKAIAKAFDYLQNEFDASSDNLTNRVILFMSDGAPEDSRQSIFNRLRFDREALNNTVVILTYGIGNENFDILKDMATENPDPQKKGVFTPIQDPHALRSEMSSYYRFFATDNNDTEPRWTQPYLDRLGAGLLVTVSMPVFVRGTLVGVTALDAPVQDIFAESTNFRPTEHSYAFIIDEKGLVMDHPLYKASVFKSIFVTITALEQDPEFLSVYESMLRGESGNKTFNSSRFIQNGTKPSNHVRKIKVLSRYIWKKVSGENFFLCLVFALNETTMDISPNNIPISGPLLYHRLDVITPKAPCKHVSRLASSDQNSLFLSERVFNDSDFYRSRNFSKSDIESIIKFIEGTGPNELNLDERIKEDVLVTKKAESLWVNSARESSTMSQFVIVRLLGTENGVFSVFPGFQVPSDFDPKVRDWYKNAIALNDLYAITEPSLSLSVPAPLITISRTLLKRSANNLQNETKEVFGVIGTAITLSFFLQRFDEVYEEFVSTGQTNSPRYYIVDTGGYVVASKSYLNIEYNKNQPIVKHLTELEPQIASVLIKSQILERVSCSLAESTLLQWQYAISQTQVEYQGSYQPTGSQLCQEFSFLSVPGTNIFILAINEEPLSCDVSISYSSHCSTCECNSEKTCTTSWWTDTMCECPCTQINSQYIPCSNEYKFSSQGSLLCTPTTREIQNPVPLLSNPNEYSNCYEISFGTSTARIQVTDILTWLLPTLAAVALISAFCGYKRQRYKKIHVTEKAKSKALETHRMTPTYQQSSRRQTDNKSLSAVSRKSSASSAHITSKERKEDRSSILSNDKCLPETQTSSMLPENINSIRYVPAPNFHKVSIQTISSKAQSMESDISSSMSKNASNEDQKNESTKFSTISQHLPTITGSDSSGYSSSTHNAPVTILSTNQQQSAESNEYSRAKAKPFESSDFNTLPPDNSALEIENID